MPSALQLQKRPHPFRGGTDYEIDRSHRLAIGLEAYLPLSAWAGNTFFDAIRRTAFAFDAGSSPPMYGIDETGAHLYGDGTQALYGTWTPLSAPPYTMVCWANRDGADTVGERACLGLSLQNTFNQFSTIGIGAPAQNYSALARTKSGGTTGTAQSTQNGGLDQWLQIAGVFRATNDRSAYQNGGNRGDNTTTVNPTAHTAFNVYATNWQVVGSLAGRLAHVCLYSRALSDDEIQELYIEPTIFVRAFKRRKFFIGGAGAQAGVLLAGGTSGAAFGARASIVSATVSTASASVSNSSVSAIVSAIVSAASASATMGGVGRYSAAVSSNAQSADQGAASLAMLSDIVAGSTGDDTLDALARIVSAVNEGVISGETWAARMAAMMGVIAVGQSGGTFQSVTQSGAQMAAAVQAGAAYAALRNLLAGLVSGASSDEVLAALAAFDAQTAAAVNASSVFNAAVAGAYAAAFDATSIASLELVAAADLLAVQIGAVNSADALAAVVFLAETISTAATAADALSALRNLRAAMASGVLSPGTFIYSVGSISSAIVETVSAGVLVDAFYSARAAVFSGTLAGSAFAYAGAVGNLVGLIVLQAALGATIVQGPRIGGSPVFN